MDSEVAGGIEATAAVGARAASPVASYAATVATSDVTGWVSGSRFRTMRCALPKMPWERTLKVRLGSGVGAPKDGRRSGS